MKNKSENHNKKDQLKVFKIIDKEPAQMEDIKFSKL